MKTPCLAIAAVLALVASAHAAQRPEAQRGVEILQPPAAPSAQEPTLGDDAPPVDEDGSEEPSDNVKATPMNARISYDLEALPQAVADLRRNLLEAARTGEIENLAPFLPADDDFVISFGGDVDPIPYWKEMSGDGEGVEVLSILIEILNTGYAVTEGENGEDLYIWPYFSALSFDELTRAQLVELYKIITPADMEDMRAFGGYIFYRLGISESGKWQYFVAGD